MPCKGRRHRPTCECPIGNSSLIRTLNSETIDMFGDDKTKAKHSVAKKSRVYICKKCGVPIRLSHIDGSQFAKYFEINGALRRHHCPSLSKLRLTQEIWEKEGWYRAVVQKTAQGGMNVVKVETIVSDLNGLFMLADETPDWIVQHCIVCTSGNNENLLLIDGLDLANQRIDQTVFAIRIK
jgi:hypothetical protein